MLSVKIDDHVELHPKAFVRKRLIQTGNLNFNVHCIVPGQKNPLHRYPITEEVLVFLDGEGEWIVGKEISKVTPRTGVSVPKDPSRETIDTGPTRMIVGLTQVPMPWEHV